MNKGKERRIREGEKKGRREKGKGERRRERRIREGDEG